jgi:hypothetical protein
MDLKTEILPHPIARKFSSVLPRSFPNIRTRAHVQIHEKEESLFEKVEKVKTHFMLK